MPTKMVLERALDSKLIALLGTAFSSRDGDRDFGRIKESIVNQAMMDCETNTIEVLLVQITGELKGNAKIVQTSRLSGFVGGNPNDCAFGGSFVLFWVLCGIKARTRAERSEKHLGRGHALIKAAIFGGLVA